MNVSFFRELIDSIVDRSRALTTLTLGGNGAEGDALQLGRQLLSRRGEASGAILAQRIISAYQELDEPGRLAFFTMLSTELVPDTDAVLQAAAAFTASPSSKTIKALNIALESPRQEFFRRLNFAPGGTQ